MKLFCRNFWPRRRLIARLLFTAILAGLAARILKGTARNWFRLLPPVRCGRSPRPPGFSLISRLGQPRREHRQVLAETVGETNIRGPHGDMDLPSTFDQPDLDAAVSAVDFEPDIVGRTGRFDRFRFRHGTHFLGPGWLRGRRLCRLPRRSNGRPFRGDRRQRARFVGRWLGPQAVGFRRLNFPQSLGRRNFRFLVPSR